MANNTEDVELREILADWEFEATGTPRHWDKTTDRLATDEKHLAKLQALIQQEANRQVEIAEKITYDIAFKDGINHASQDIRRQNAELLDRLEQSADSEGRIWRETLVNMRRQLAAGENVAQTPNSGGENLAQDEDAVRADSYANN